MITPIHIIAAVPVKIFFPKHFSLLWFTIVNILIDVEVLYYLIMSEWPIHRFFHSFVGVSIIVEKTLGVAFLEESFLGMIFLEVNVAP